MLCLCCCVRAASGCREQGFSHPGASLISGLLPSRGFSCLGALALGLTRISSSAIEADLLHGTRCLPGQGVEPHPLRFQVGS